jgi:hypothetical protein
MRKFHMLALAALTASSAIVMAQSATDQQQPQLTPVPPRPTCTPILKNGSCADLWRAYNQASGQRLQEELQIYVNRQKDLASAQATAPLQQTISDLKNLNDDQQAQIAKLQQQMQADASTALDAKAESHMQGIKEGVGIGAAGMLILCALIFGIRRLTQNFSVTRKVVA